MDSGTKQPDQEPTFGTLYGSGTGLSSIELTNDLFLPLLHSIEQTIVDFIDHAAGPGYTGGSILLVVKQLGMNHEAPTADPLGRAIISSLKSCLAVNNYSRQDVKGALRAVAKSVDRHTRDGGIAGYVNFVRPFLKGG